MKNKILIVDDDANTRKALAEFLEQKGQENIRTAPDGVEGLKTAQEFDPDLIITDVSMPHMDGYTFVQELRRQDFLKSIPVIVLTGRGEMVDLFKLAEIHNYLIKPVDPKSLLDMVDRVLKRSEASVPHNSETLFEKVEKVEAALSKKSESKSAKPKELSDMIKKVLGREKRGQVNKKTWGRR